VKFNPIGGYTGPNPSASPFDYTVTTDAIPYDASPLDIQKAIQDKIDDKVLSSSYEQKIYLPKGSETKYTQGIDLSSLASTVASFNLDFDGKSFVVRKDKVKEDIEREMKKLPSIATVTVAPDGTNKWKVTYTIKGDVPATGAQQLSSGTVGIVIASVVKVNEKFTLSFGTNVREISKSNAVAGIETWLEGLTVAGSWNTCSHPIYPQQPHQIKSLSRLPLINRHLPLGIEKRHRLC
jgi:hypothetical protein